MVWLEFLAGEERNDEGVEWCAYPRYGWDGYPFLAFGILAIECLLSYLDKIVQLLMTRECLQYHIYKAETT